MLDPEGAPITEALDVLAGQLTRLLTTEGGP
jgi:hypothetical protein